jgi:Flp pilus assembly protein TadD
MAAMSLINQMLRDLEERRRKEAPETSQVSVVIPSTKRRWPWLVVGVAVIGAAVAVWQWPERSLPVPKPVVVAAMEPVAEGVAEPAPVGQPVVDNAQLVSVQASETSEQFRVVFELSRSVDWRVAATAAQAMTLAVPVDGVPSSQSDTLTLLAGWNSRPQDGGSELELTATAPVAWKVFSLDADDHHGWRMVVQGRRLQPQPVVQIEKAPVAPPTEVTPKPVEESAPPVVRKQLSARDQLWAQAQQFRQQGELVRAAAALDQLLVVQPEDREARLALIKVLLQQRQQDQALRVASAGREQQPDDTLWLILRARLLAETDQLAEALYELDVEQAPTVAASPEFYALKAALLQRAMRFDEALPIYQLLCEAFPQQAPWWFGRAVTASQLGDRDQARDSFKRALNLPGLEMSLKQYATQQLQRLGEN